MSRWKDRQKRPKPLVLHGEVGFDPLFRLPTVKTTLGEFISAVAKSGVSLRVLSRDDPTVESIYQGLCALNGKESYTARFYDKFIDGWYPKWWTKEELEAELARPSQGWSKKMDEAAADVLMGKREDPDFFFFMIGPKGRRGDDWRGGIVEP